MLEFSKIKKENIFGNEFENFSKNNVIKFSNNGIAVLYAPNGVGKTSFSKILNSENNCSFTVKYSGSEINEQNNSLFYVISDQNSRHIIKGKTKEFLLGDNIREEFELKEEIDKNITEILENKLNKSLKDNFNISKVKSSLIDSITDGELKGYIRDIVNKNSRGKNIKVDEFAKKIKNMNVLDIQEFSDKKFAYYINDVENKDSIINKINNIVENDINGNPKIEEIEENTVAIEILNKYSHKTQCIVCDNAEMEKDLLSKKVANKQKVFEELNETEKLIITDIVEKLQHEDPFNIKEKLIETLKSGNKEILHELTDEFHQYAEILNKKINNLFAKDLLTTDLIKKIETFFEMVKNKPVLSDADMLFIQEIINNNIEKNLSIERDSENNLKIMLDNSEFIGKEREELSLSTGEQNFISLTFELLKAKNSDKQIIVLDDPISSFDSIYKNKIVYSIVKFLESKKQIILTHNTDLIRLLEVQRKQCFNLYLFNNFEGQENGFIEVNENEKNILIYLPDLLDFIRNNVDNFIHNEKEYLCSLIPFMRGYAKFIGSTKIKNELTKVMHGYSPNSVNITQIYNELFDKNISTVYTISVTDILSLDLGNLDILSDTEYPLLNKTLKHSLTYLYLRLLVEKKLVNTYNVNFNKYDNLGAIIFNAYAGNGQEKIKKRVFLISKKTLLNEFNHFEGNMSIFQPAIDISDYTLEKEKNDIINFINNE